MSNADYTALRAECGIVPKTRSAAAVSARLAFISSQRAAGIPDQETADALGIDPSAISRFAKRHGLPAKARRRGGSLLEELKRRFDYDAATGKFTHKTGRARGRTVEPYSHGCGYIKIMVWGAPQRAHRMAWLYVFGVLPEGDLDHINRDRSDNRISNLRQVDRYSNSQNVGLRRNNTSGFKGVSYRAGLWDAVIRSRGRQYYGGSHPTPEAAARAYDALALKLNGECACTNAELGLLVSAAGGA
jgi:hypothetical protein